VSMGGEPNVVIPSRSKTILDRGSKRHNDNDKIVYNKHGWICEKVSRNYYHCANGKLSKLFRDQAKMEQYISAQILKVEEPIRTADRVCSRNINPTRKPDKTRPVLLSSTSGPLVALGLMQDVPHSASTSKSTSRDGDES
jgi:hypothetical protein